MWLISYQYFMKTTLEAGGSLALQVLPVLDVK